jgi:hypothetical protein
MRWSATRYKLIVTNAEGQLLPPVTPSSQRCSLEQKDAEEFEELLASMVTCDLPSPRRSLHWFSDESMNADFFFFRI